MNILHDAVAMGNMDLIQRFINEGADLDQPHSETKESLLMIALSKGQLQVVQLLLDEEASFYVDAADDTRRSTGLAGAAGSVLKKALEMAQSLPLGKLRYHALAQIYEEFALAHLKDRNESEGARYFQLAVDQLESIKEESWLYLNKLYAFNAQCGLAFYQAKQWERAICHDTQAIFYLRQLVVKTDDSEFLKKMRTSLVDTLIRFADSHYRVGNQDEFNLVYQQILNTLLSMDKSQRDKEFYSTVAYVFAAWSSHKAVPSGLEYDLYELASAMMIGGDGEQEHRDEDISNYIDIIGVLTSRRGAAQYHHLLTPMIQVMTLVLESYTSEHYGNIEFKAYLQDDGNRKRFELKLEELKKLRISPLYEMTASSAGVVQAMVNEMRELKVRNEALSAEVEMLKARLANTSPGVSVVASSAPTLFVPVGLKRVRDEKETQLDADESEQKRARLEGNFR